MNHLSFERNGWCPVLDELRNAHKEEHAQFAAPCSIIQAEPSYFAIKNIG